MWDNLEALSSWSTLSCISCEESESSASVEWIDNTICEDVERGQLPMSPPLFGYLESVR
jgi:hypothetical protein